MVINGFGGTKMRFNVKGLIAGLLVLVTLGLTLAPATALNAVPVGITSFGVTNGDSSTMGIHKQPACPDTQFVVENVIRNSGATDANNLALAVSLGQSASPDYTNTVWVTLFTGEMVHGTNTTGTHTLFHSDTVALTDFGIVPLADFPYYIHALLWEDADNDGFIDNNETHLDTWGAGQYIEFYDCDGSGAPSGSGGPGGQQGAGALAISVDFDDEIHPGEELEIEVNLENTGNDTLHDVEAKVWLEDSDGKKLTDKEDLNYGSLGDGDDEDESAVLEIPIDADEDSYTLVIEVESKEDVTATYLDYVDVEKEDHSLAIKSARLDPTEASCGATVNVRVDILNNGADDEEDVKVRVRSSALGVSTSSTYYEVEEDEDQVVYLTFEVPSTATEGSYTIDITAYNDEVEASESEAFTVYSCGGQTGQTGATGTAGASIGTGGAVGLAAGNSVQSTAAGTGVVYGMTMVNNANTLKTYTMSVSGTDGWATARVDPAVVSLDSGMSKTVYVYLLPNQDAQTGDYSFTVYAKEGGTTLGSTNLVTSVTASDLTSNALADTLKWVFAGFVVVVVALFAVWLWKKGEEEESRPEPEQVYY